MEGDDNEGEEVEEDEGEGGGWGGWGALGRWKSSLHKAAAGAVKDVSELTESFQQVRGNVQAGSALGGAGVFAFLCSKWTSRGMTAADACFA